MTTNNPSTIAQFAWVNGNFFEVTLCGNLAILHHGYAFSVVSNDRKFYGCCKTFGHASKLVDQIQLGVRVAFAQR